MATPELVRKPASANNDGELDSSQAQTIAGDKVFTGAVTGAGTQTKWQKKEISSTINSDTTFITFNNLVVGKTYKLYHHFSMLLNAVPNQLNIKVNHDGGILFRTIAQIDHDNIDRRVVINGAHIFTATNTTLGFETEGASGNAVIEDSLFGENPSFAIIEELPNHVETTDFT